MEMNRNQYFFLAIILVLVGLQFRAVDAYVLTSDTTQFLAERLQRGAAVSATGMKKVLQPPPWLGWCLMSVGAVLFFHSLAMKKPD
ncbi:hypothetical protein Mal64_10900 [Pseudobythopirellula maris]|uniref:Uncharacterized protein n=1 Tax=Pseudobythopirellula maris TaxID=2527991 RepID=A0A5C5ZUB4_9BACT|nr:hypothetical protein [Pseudobythopirellula maris]TWT90695.1 hypothetical protein Mal64_10900 [Pseudobythopirellula maris]